MEGYEGREEWKWEIEYIDSSGKDINLDALIELADYSEGCKQFISWKCSNATINRPQNSTENEEDSNNIGTNSNILTTWRNRVGMEPLFFGGASPEKECLDDQGPYDQEGTLLNYVYQHAGAPGKMLCACGLTKTCSNPDLLCNCDDTESKETQIDGGFITDRCQLPVTQFSGGDTGNFHKLTHLFM